MPARLESEPFDPYAALLAHEATLPRGKHGAATSFVGTMRDFNEGDEVTGMFLEHYPEMTERQLETLVDEATERWPLLDALVVHRVGAIRPGDPIVLVAAWSAHRGAAFEACRYLIEELKHRATFWKKETLRDGERWVDRNTGG